jgi:hypothetical protein
MRSSRTLTKASRLRIDQANAMVYWDGGWVEEAGEDARTRSATGYDADVGESGATGTS